MDVPATGWAEAADAYGFTRSWSKRGSAVSALIARGALSLDGLITHHDRVEHADTAYRTAFGDVACLKMGLDWRHTA